MNIQAIHEYFRKKMYYSRLNRKYHLIYELYHIRHTYSIPFFSFITLCTLFASIACFTRLETVCITCRKYRKLICIKGWHKAYSVTYMCYNIPQMSSFVRYVTVIPGVMLHYLASSTRYSWKTYQIKFLLHCLSDTLLCKRFFIINISSQPSNTECSRSDTECSWYNSPPCFE